MKKRYKILSWIIGGLLFTGVVYATTQTFSTITCPAGQHIYSASSTGQFYCSADTAGTGISGSGTSTQIAYFNSSSTLTSDSGLSWVGNALTAGNIIINSLGGGAYGIGTPDAVSPVDFIVLTGNALDGGTFGSGFFVYAGSATSTGYGGGVNVYGGDGGFISGNGGSINYVAGNARGGNSKGGNVYFSPGVGHGSGLNGSIVFTDASSGESSIFNTSLISSDRTFTFPDKSGTFGLLDDINKMVVSSTQVIAGTGLSGGGALTGNVTLTNNGVQTLTGSTNIVVSTATGTPTISFNSTLSTSTITTATTTNLNFTTATGTTLGFSDGTKQTTAYKDFAFTVYNASTTQNGASSTIQKIIYSAMNIYQIDCSTDGASVTLVADERASSTPQTYGTAVFNGTGLVCPSTGISTSTFSNAGMAANSVLNFGITATSNATTTLRVSCRYKEQ